MVRVPDDLAVRIRMQAESALRAAQPAAAIPDELPEPHPGRRFSAQVTQALPDGLYKALVDGKPLTLALAEGAQAGDTLDLVVIARTPAGIVAQRATGTAPPAAATPDSLPTLSRTAQAIGALLSADHPPAALNRGAPLLSQPPLAAAPLAQALAAAVRQSGLFYESHQVQWSNGRLPLEQLLLEPQGRHSSAALLARHAIEAAPPPAEDGSTHAGLPIPEDLRPLVRQQLDAAATHRAAWHGEAWPGQALDWDIEWQQEQERRGEGESEAAWTTGVSLRAPRLGDVHARLRLTAAGVRVSVVAAREASTDELRSAAPALERALAAAGIALQEFQVRQADEPS